MHVDLFGVVLFLHIGLVLVAFAMAGVVHAAMPAMARARDVATMRPWTELLHRLDPLFPLVALAILGLGAWLVHLGAHTDDAFSFKDGWIITAIVSLVVIEGLAGSMLAPTAKKLVEQVRETPDGAVPADLHQATLAGKIWYPGHIATFGFLGIVFLMAAKPDGAYAPLFPVVGALVGIVLARVQLQRLAATQAPTPSAGVPGQRATDESAQTKA